MFNMEEFKRRRKQDKYISRDDRYDIFNEKKPNSELVQRMDTVINKLDTIIESIEDLVSDNHIEIHTDFDELNRKVFEKYYNKESEKNESTENCDKTMNKHIFDIPNMNEYKCGTKKDASVISEVFKPDNIIKSALGKDRYNAYKKMSQELMNQYIDILKKDGLFSTSDTSNKCKVNDDKNMSIAGSDKLLNDMDYLLETMIRMNPDKSDDAIIISYEKLRSCLDEMWLKDSVNKEPERTIFCILGESGSGKDSLVNYTLDKYKLNLKLVVSYTDRKKRENEREGVEHFFIDKDTMTSLLHQSDEIVAYTKIGDVRYCATLQDVENSDIYIIDPDGLKLFKEMCSERFNIVSIYIDCPVEERRKRIQKRGDSLDKFEARTSAENKQFAKFRAEHGYDYILDNGNLTTIDEASQKLIKIFKK